MIQQARVRLLAGGPGGPPVAAEDGNAALRDRPLKIAALATASRFVAIGSVRSNRCNVPRDSGSNRSMQGKSPMSLQVATPSASQGTRFLLRVTDPSLKTSYLPLSGSRQVVGRGSELGVVLDSPSVSPSCRARDRSLRPLVGSRPRQPQRHAGQRPARFRIDLSAGRRHGDRRVSDDAVGAAAGAGQVPGAPETATVQTSETAPRISRIGEFETPRIEAATSRLSRVRTSAQRDAGRGRTPPPALPAHDRARVPCPGGDGAARARRRGRLSQHSLRAGSLPRLARARAAHLQKRATPGLRRSRADPRDQRRGPRQFHRAFHFARRHGDDRDRRPASLRRACGRSALRRVAPAVRARRLAGAGGAGGRTLPPGRGSLGQRREDPRICRRLPASSRWRRQIQLRLVPRDVRIEGLEIAIGFVPCHWVGGDFVDVVPMRDGRGCWPSPMCAGRACPPPWSPPAFTR